MTADLTEWASELARWLPTAQALIAQPDTDGIRSRTQPTSRPPWNGAVANVLYDALEGVRQLEQDIRTEVTGHLSPRRPISRTGTTIHAITQLSHAIDLAKQREAAHRISRWVFHIQQLAAIDKIPHWQRIRPSDDGLPATCPYCGVSMLLVAAWDGTVIVACGVDDCLDNDGHRPRGRIEHGQFTHQPCLVWADGTIQTAP